jgi:RNA polymerase sigma-70 factor, ECF subfamily
LAQRFEELILPHIDAAYNLARYLLRDAAAADDVVQEAFRRAYRSFSGYRGGDPKSWVLAIVRNCCSTFHATEAKDRVASPLDLNSVEDSQHDTPEQAVVRQSEVDAVRALIVALPEPFREALVLRELEDLSYKQIAQVTGVPVGTVMSRLARARQMLRDAAEAIR